MLGRQVVGALGIMAAKKQRQHHRHIYLLHKKGEFVGAVEAQDKETAIKIAIEQFAIRDPEKQKWLSAQRAD
jgi:hypothetical protein